MAREGVILRCEQCKNENYLAKRNKKKQTDKISCMKYCKNCNYRQMHNEKK